jgi:hypothetical protein
LTAAPAAPVDTFTVALTDSVDWERVATPTNDSERLLFRQLFETLVGIDCHGQIRPAVAARWSSDSTGRIWTFTLPEPSQLTDHRSISATDVAVSWKAHWADVQALGIDSAVALDDRTLRVTLRETRDSAPRLFAEPLLSVAYRTAVVYDSSKRVVVPSVPPVDFQLRLASDPRDALDRGIDLVVTRDPAVAEYVSARPEFVTFPLPWSRTYILLQPTGAELIKGVSFVDSVARSLARDVAGTEARPAEAPFWLTGPQACLFRSSFIEPQPKAPRILYPRSDEVARNIAERIVALAAGPRLTAAGLSDLAFAAALGVQEDLGYVVALPRQVPAPCYRSQTLPQGASIQPLIDTRARAIVRRGVPVLRVDWDGIIDIGEWKESSSVSP